MRLLLLLATAVLGSANAAAACEAPEPATFRIVHETFGEIGRHALNFRCEEEDLVVETDAHIEIEVLAVAAESTYMPPKSTFFHPKAATGLVFHPLAP